MLRMKKKGCPVGSPGTAFTMELKVETNQPESFDDESNSE